MSVISRGKFHFLGKKREYRQNISIASSRLAKLVDSLEEHAPIVSGTNEASYFFINISTIEVSIQSLISSVNCQSFTKG